VIDVYAQVLGLGLLFWPKPEVAAQQPVPANTLVSTHLQSPDFRVRDTKYRVFYLKQEQKTIPLQDYDFAAALTDELVNVLAEDKRSTWRAPGPEETLSLASYFDAKRKGALQSVKADRLLLVDVEEYGASVSQLGKDKFYIIAHVRLLDASTGREIWGKGHMSERIDLPGKLNDLQADSQRGLKEGMNRALEEFSRQVKDKISGAKF
jgi:hypothetical protein